MKYRHSYLLMAPFLILFVLFTLLPVLLSIIMGFTDYDLLNFPRFIGMGNYSRLFLDDDIFLIAIRNTLILALVSGPLSYLLCFLFAWLINELRPLSRSFATLVFYAPILSGQAFMVWQFIFSSDRYGVINGFLMNAGIINDAINWFQDTRYILTVIIIVQIWLSFGTGFLAFIAGLQGIDQSLYEAGSIDGVRNRFQELWFITLPQMVPQLIFGAVMQIIAAFSVADVPIALAGYPSTEYAAETIVTHIMDYGTTRFEMGFACAIATILFIMMYFSNKGVSKILNRVGR